MDGSRAAGLNLAVSDPTADVEADAARSAAWGVERGAARTEFVAASAVALDPEASAKTHGESCSCVEPYAARPSMEALGIDVTRTRQAAGWSDVAPPGQVTLNGIVLIVSDLASLNRRARRSRADSPRPPPRCGGASRDGLARLEVVVDHTGRDPAATTAANPVTGAV